MNERTVTVEILNSNAIYRANLKGEVIEIIYKVTFYQWHTPLSHWPTNHAGLSDLISDYLVRGTRPK